MKRYWTFVELYNCYGRRIFIYLLLVVVVSDCHLCVCVKWFVILSLSLLSSPFRCRGHVSFCVGSCDGSPSLAASSSRLLFDGRPSVRRRPSPRRPRGLRLCDHLEHQPKWIHDWLVDDRVLVNVPPRNTKNDQTQRTTTFSIRITKHKKLSDNLSLVVTGFDGFGELIVIVKTVKSGIAPVCL